MGPELDMRGTRDIGEKAEQVEENMFLGLDANWNSVPS